ADEILIDRDLENLPSTHWDDNDRWLDAEEWMIPAAHWNDADVWVDAEPWVLPNKYSVIVRSKTGEEWGPCAVDSIVGREIVLNAADRAIVTSEMGSLASILPDDRSERATILICEGEVRPFNALVVS